MTQVHIEVRDRKWNRDMRQSEFNAKTRVYFFHDDETILDNFGNRAARPRDLYATYLSAIALQMGLPQQTKFRWSQKAGCRCGCSPGFICEDSFRKDVFVTLKGAPKTNNNPEDLAQAEYRKAALVNQLVAEERGSKMLRDDECAGGDALIPPKTADQEYAEQLQTMLDR